MAKINTFDGNIGRRGGAGKKISSRGPVKQVSPSFSASSGTADFNEDTIAAIATPIGEGALGIVRVSGLDAVRIVAKAFKAKNNKSLSTQKSFSMRYGWMIGHSGEVIDEVIVSLMRSPKSYTREDVVEISSHGGYKALSAILELIVDSGARLAAPGEFTKRAFLNGRLDLAQAEAVLDVIQAKSELSLRNSLAQLNGKVSECVSAMRGSLLELLADLEAKIDFSQEDETHDEVDFSGRIDGLISELDVLIERGLKGRILREGLKVVIYGRPNVGKSSLLNALLKEDRAIVTPIAGTTRDTVEEYINIKGLAARLIDTAGITEYKNEIDKEALCRTKRALESSDIVLFVLDSSSVLSHEDLALAQEAEGKRKIIVVNKSDLERRLDLSEVEKVFSLKPVLISASLGKNLHALEDEIFKSFFDKVPSTDEGAFVSNTRHIAIFKRGLSALLAARNSLSEGVSLEFASLDVKKALDSLGEITGEVFSEELLDVIFSKFCVGK